MYAVHKVFCHCHPPREPHPRASEKSYMRFTKADKSSNHSSHSPDTLRSMHRYRIGRIEGHWINFTPPIQGGVFRARHVHEIDQGSSRIPIDNLATAPACTPALQLNDKTTEAGVKHDTNAIPGTAALVSPETYTAAKVQRDIDIALARYPALDATTQDNIALRFQAFHQRVKDDGFYTCRFSEYGKEIVRYAALFALFASCLSRGWYLISACFLGLFWHQIMFSAHDAGHRGITHNFTVDTLIGIFIADVCCGLSIGWWKSSHNVHHLVTNLPVINPPPMNTTPSSKPFQLR